MSYLKVGNVEYEVPEVKDQEQTFTEIDFLALLFYNATNDRLKNLIFTQIYTRALPFIQNIVSSYTRVLIRERDEIIAVLCSDLWRLLKLWEPRDDFMEEKNKSCRFHYLMLRQFRNKAINEVKNRIKPQENKRYVDLLQATNLEHLPETVIRTHDNSVLDSLASRDLIEKLLQEITDTKTRKIIELTVEDTSMCEIKDEIGGKALRAIRRRQEACRPTIISLLYTSYTDFMDNLIENVDNTVDRQILQKFCMGRDIDDIKNTLNLDLSRVKKCINKYKPKILSMLLGG